MWRKRKQLDNGRNVISALIFDTLSVIIRVTQFILRGILKDCELNRLHHAVVPKADRTILQT